MTKRNRRGAMAVLIAVCLPVLLALAAFAIQFAYLDLGRVELRVATDAAAEAAARELSNSGDTNNARSKAQEAALKNTVAGLPCVITNGDITFGRVTQATSEDRFVFTAGTEKPNAVRITTQAQRNHLFRAFGRDAFNISNSTVAGQIDRDVSIVLDRSGSMASVNDDGSSTNWQSGDPAPSTSRWYSAANAAALFLVTLQNETPMDEKVSLVTYADTALVDDDLTFTYTNISSSIDGYSQAYDGGNTNIADGILKAQQTLMSTTYGRSWASKTMVVMTDGNHNAGSVTPVQAAQDAAALGIVVHTITYGNDADQSAMQAVANAGGGEHWHAPDGAALNAAFEEIASNLPTMLME